MSQCLEAAGSTPPDKAECSANHLIAATPELWSETEIVYEGQLLHISIQKTTKGALAWVFIIAK